MTTLTETTPAVVVDPRILSCVDYTVKILVGQRDVAISIDDQNDFGAYGGALYVPGAEETRAASLEFFYRWPENRRFTTGDAHTEDHCSFTQWPPHCIAGTKGAELVPGLAGLPVRAHIAKGRDKNVDSYSAVKDDAGNSNGLVEILDNDQISRTFLFRHCLDFCVGGTALHLAEKGFEVYILVDLTCAIGVDLPEGNSIDIMLKKLVAAGVKFIFSSQVEFE